MFTGPVSQLNAINAANNWMNAADSLRNLAFTGCCGDPASTSSAEKNLRLQMLNDSFEYQAYSAMQDMQDRINKDKIKRSFSIFA